MVNNIFSGNYASYGPDLASYAVKVVLSGTNQNKVYLTEVGSGIKIDHDIRLSLVDNDGQVMSQENDSSLKILPSRDSSIFGSHSVNLNNGTAVFRDLTFISSQGRKNVTFKVTSPLLDRTRIIYGVGASSYNEAEFENYFDVSFRF